MAALDLQVVRGQTQHANFQAEGNPQDAEWLRLQLHGWLKGNHWRESQWNAFSIRVRRRGSATVISTVRAV